MAIAVSSPVTILTPTAGRRPGRIAHIGLATVNISDLSGIRQNQLEITVTQNVPDRLLVAATLVICCTGSPSERRRNDPGYRHPASAAGVIRGMAGRARGRRSRPQHAATAT
jgi:hypothetical protein